MSTKVIEQGKPWTSAKTEQEKTGRAIVKTLEAHLSPDELASTKRKPNPDSGNLPLREAIKSCLK